MTTQYWIRSLLNGDDVALYRFDGTEGEHVNRAQEWQIDNRKLAEISGIGGDVDWREVSKDEAAVFLEDHAPGLKP